MIQIGPLICLIYIAGSPPWILGVAAYWAAAVDDPATSRVVDDIAWCYAEPLPESLAVQGFLSFDATRVDVVAELPLTRRSSDAQA